MHKVLTVAKMVFKRRVLSPAYYWMILTPLLLLLVGIGFAKYTAQQSINHRATIAVVANDKVKTALAQQAGESYRVNSKVNTKNPKQVKAALADHVIDGVLYVNRDFTKIEYQSNADSSASNPAGDLRKHLTTIKSQYAAQKAGINAQQWQTITQPVQLKQQAVTSHGSIVKQQQTEHAQIIGELIVIIAFFFLTSYISITGAEIGAEKGNHLIEGILAAIPAKRYFAGKMLGLGYLIIFQLLLYVVLGVGGYSFYQHFFSKSRFNIKQYLVGISPQYILITVLLTLTSFLLYIFLAAIFAAFVTKAQDISQATTSVAGLVFIPYILSFFTLDNPNTLVAKALSFIPYMSQGIMPIRIASGAASYASGYLAVLLSLAATIAMYMAAARIYQANAFVYRDMTPIKLLLSKITHRQSID